MSLPGSRQAKKPSGKSAVMVSVLVPIVVALIGLAGTIVTAFFTSESSENRGRSAAETAIAPTIRAYETQLALVGNAAIPPPTQLITITQIVAATPTPDPNVLDVLKVNDTVFAFGGVDEGLTGLGTLSFLTNRPDSGYRFDYTIPDQTKGYAGFVFRFSKATDLTEYRTIELEISFDEGSVCDIFMRDDTQNKNVQYLRLGDRELVNGSGVQETRTENRRFITTPLKDNFKEVNKQRVKEIGFNANSDFVTGTHGLIVHSLRFVK